jgi:hypothetical protein
VFRSFLPFVSSAALVALALSACSSATETSQRPEARFGESPDGGTPWVEPPRPDTPVTCAALPTYTACSDCCVAAHPAGVAVVWDTLRTCICRKPDPSCVDTCGPEYCGGTSTYTSAGKACRACIEHAFDTRDQDCLSLAGEACEFDAQCRLAIACDDTCPEEPIEDRRDGGSPSDADAGSDAGSSDAASTDADRAGDANAAG